MMMKENDYCCTFKGMKKHALLLVLVLSGITLFAQKADTVKSWQATAEIDNNFLADLFMVGFSGTFDRKWLHTEIRYNSEDFHTLSLWGGYDFSGGNKFTYTITPMMGVMAGNSAGILPGVSITLEFWKFSLSSETAFVVYSSSRRAENYIYTSNEIDFSPCDYFFLGFSVTRSRIYTTGNDIQRGFGAGVTFHKLCIAGYAYDIMTPEAFGLISISCDF
jgi:hypothetical protein